MKGTKFTFLERCVYWWSEVTERSSDLIRISHGESSRQTRLLNEFSWISIISL